jgi:mRNA interferase MazF
MMPIDKINRFLDWVKKKIKLDFNSNKAKNRIIFRGEVYGCNLGIGIGSEKRKHRPALILQNDTGNKFSSNTIIAPITNSKGIKKVSAKIPENKYKRKGKNYYLSGYVDLSQIRIVSKSRLTSKFIDKKFDKNDMKRVNVKILSSIGLYSKYKKMINQRKRDKSKIDELLDDNYSLNKENKRLKNTIQNEIDNETIKEIIIKTDDNKYVHSFIV